MLFDYQLQAVQQLLELEKTNKITILSNITGSGKTRVVIEMAMRDPPEKRTLFCISPLIRSQWENEFSFFENPSVVFVDSIDSQLIKDQKMIVLCCKEITSKNQHSFYRVVYDDLDTVMFSEKIISDDPFMEFEPIFNAEKYTIVSASLEKYIESKMKNHNIYDRSISINKILGIYHLKGKDHLRTFTVNTIKKLRDPFKIFICNKNIRAQKITEFCETIGDEITWDLKPPRTGVHLIGLYGAMRLYKEKKKGMEMYVNQTNQCGICYLDFDIKKPDPYFRLLCCCEYEICIDCYNNLCKQYMLKCLICKKKNGLVILDTSIKREIDDHNYILEKVFDGVGIQEITTKENSDIPDDTIGYINYISTKGKKTIVYCHEQAGPTFNAKFQNSKMLYGENAESILLEFQSDHTFNTLLIVDSRDLSGIDMKYIDCIAVFNKSDDLQKVQQLVGRALRIGRNIDQPLLIINETPGSFKSIISGYTEINTLSKIDL